MLEMVRQRCRRIGTLPIPRRLRAHKAAVTVVPKVFYAPVGPSLTKQQEFSITMQLSIASSGNNLNNCEARELEWSLYRPLHHHHAPCAKITRLMTLVQSLYAENPVGVMMQLQHFANWFVNSTSGRIHAQVGKHPQCNPTWACE